ncbi:hypothetical protein EH31_10635 [Erythrobacter longus]|uniref:Uncharacterized protein n=1 Tax=Erythrobacter longus TaxID=1044 RepID=A0A074MCN3_ERYLO|nr:hypothetical protein EH31_10635 [Erythrobacter longus]
MNSELLARQSDQQEDCRNQHTEAYLENTESRESLVYVLTIVFWETTITIIHRCTFGRIAGPHRIFDWRFISMRIEVIHRFSPTFSLAFKSVTGNKSRVFAGRIGGQRETYSTFDLSAVLS